MSPAGVPDSEEALSVTICVADIRCTSLMAPGNPANSVLQSPSSEEPIEIDGRRASELASALVQAGARINSGANAMTLCREVEMTCRTIDDQLGSQAQCTFKNVLQH